MDALARSLYRSRQFFGALRPRVDEGLRDTAFGLLTDGERGLFGSMTVRDQQHALEVYRALRDQWHDDRDLLAAALLHDCGKGRISLWHRVAFVLLEAVSPTLVDGVASPGDGAGWRQALYRCKHHRELGAEVAGKAGSSDVTVALIRGDTTSSQLRGTLAALEAADDAV